jgi:hypothetical protein
MTTEPRILKRAPMGWNQDNYDVLEDGVIVGRIFKVPIAPQDRPWMWASGHNGHVRRAAHGLRADAGGRDGGVRQELAARRSSAPAWRPLRPPSTPTMAFAPRITPPRHRPLFLAAFRSHRVTGRAATSGNSTTFYDYGAHHRPRDHHQHWHDLLQQQGPDHWPSEPMRMTTEEYTWMLSELSKLSANDLTRLPRSRAAPRMGRAVPLQDQGTSS